MPENSPHVALAILNYNGRSLLENFLPSLLAVQWPNISVWVIDNASTDDSVAWLQEHHPAVGLIQNSSNAGFAGGYNAGLKHIAADYYVLINSDVEVPPGFLHPVIAAMENDAAIAFAQPKMRWLRHPALFEYAGAAGGLLDGLGYPLCRGRLFENLEKDTGQYDDDAFVFWASGACLFARAHTYWQLGGFYPYFFMHQEEIDLCWRAQNKGFKILACGQSMAMHLGGASLHKENPRKTLLNFRNNLIMITRNMPVTRLLWVLPLRWMLDGIAAASLLYRGKNRDAMAVIKAWMGYAGWLFGRSSNKWPANRKFGNLQGVAQPWALWQRFFMKKAP